MPRPDLYPVNVRITQDMKDRLQALADRLFTGNFSEAVRRALIEYVERQCDEQEQATA